MITQDGLQRLPLQRNAVPATRPEFFDDLEVSVIFDTGDEPAVIGVNAVEQPKIVVAEIEQDEGASYPLTGG